MSYAETLLEGYNAIHDVEAPWNTLEKEKDFFSTSIKNFFAEDGEGSNIRELYNKLHKGTLKITTEHIIQEDFNHAEEVYDEYLEGMRSFVEEVHQYKDMSDTSMVHIFEEKIDKAVSVDHGFIEMLESAPNINPSKDIPVAEAVSVLGNMIDFIPRMNDQVQACEFIKENLESNEMTKNSAKLICESISYYWLSSIQNMFKGYDALYEAVMHTSEKPKANQFVLV